MSLKAKIEAVIYAAEEPVTLAQLAAIFAAEVPVAEAPPAEAASPFEEAPQQLDAPLAESELTILDEAGNMRVLSPSEDDAEAPRLESETLDTAAATSDAVIPEAAAETAADLEATTKRAARQREREVRDHIRAVVDELISDYVVQDRGTEIREIAGGYRMATKPEYHDAVRAFVKSLKPVMKLSPQALETLAVIAYKQPVTAPEVGEIRGVDSGGVLASLISRKLVTTAGRKQVIGRPILYKTTKEFLLRFGLKDLAELPSTEEFEKMAVELAESEELEASALEGAESQEPPSSPVESLPFEEDSAEPEHSDAAETEQMETVPESRES
jgi:segregation and condensation protein B